MSKLGGRLAWILALFYNKVRKGEKRCYQKTVLELSKQHSVIRDIFEFGMQRAKEVGPENVFDFSIGNPSVPAPKEVDETAIRYLQTLDPVESTVIQATRELQKSVSGCGSLNRRFGTHYTENNIFMTIGAAAALGICFRTLVDGRRMRLLRLRRISRVSGILLREPAVNW